MNQKNEGQEITPITFTITQAAKYLGVSNSSMRRHIQNAPLQLPAFKLNGRGARRLSKADLDAFVQSQRDAEVQRIEIAIPEPLGILGRGKMWDTLKKGKAG